jgi:S1-C subfamily serine protease
MLPKEREKMSRRTIGLIAGLGCLGLIVVLVLLGVMASQLFITSRQTFAAESSPTIQRVAPRQAQATQQAVPTLPPASPPRAVTQPAIPVAPSDALGLGLDAGTLTALYDAVNPGVVNIQATLPQGGSTGSGFLIDEQGHIVTNNHVVDGASSLVVVYYNGHQAKAEIVGTDDDSDLAVIKVDDIPDGVRPLRLGDSEQVQVGEWVIAIGSPFGLGSTMTLGIVSARGRTIPSGVTPFSIPEAIQTDAAINPGNSGGPLLNLRGEVIGVNAQIASGGVRANAGVGFSIPVNTVRRVAPTLIENGVYIWPWLGVSGGSVGMVVQQANGLETQQGAYIASVSEGGPAADAGLRGATRTVQIDGGQVPVGGDVVIAIDGTPIANFDELLREIASRAPGDRVELTVLRDGRQLNLIVDLEARPQDFS